MKRYLAGILLLLGTTTLAAVTNDLTPSDVYSRGFASDYGMFTLTVNDFAAAPVWDELSDPPISVARAIHAVKQHLPSLQNRKWILTVVGLEDFDGKGWYYLVRFENHSTFTQDRLHYVVTKDYIAAVLMDGRVLAPSTESE